MKKTAILPIVTIICLGIGTLIGKPIGKDTVDMIATITATAFTAGISIWGVIKDHTKKGEVK
jgi:uncharacterized membrane protein YcaP (DUF421 family)